MKLKFRLSRQSLIVVMLCFTFIISSFPLARPANATSGYEIAVGEIRMFAYNSVPDGWVYCNGQTLESTDATRDLRVLLQGRFGVTGTVPDLRAKESVNGVGYYIATEGVDPYNGFDLNSVVGEIRIFASGITPANFKSASGSSLLAADYPDLFNHIGYHYGGGNGAYFALPYIGHQGALIPRVEYYIATSGVTPSESYNYLGAISMYSVPVTHSSLLRADGVPLDISSNSELYNLYSTVHGGDGINTFGIPNLATDYAGEYVSSHYYVHTTGLSPTLSGAAPITNSDSYSISQNTALNINSSVLGVGYNDSNDATAFYLYSQPSHGTVTLNADGTFSYSPDDDYAGSDSFKYRASNNYASSPVTTVHITVVESAPVISGVVDGGTYNTPTVITYTNGTATLDGVPFTSGSTVSDVGSHTLVITTPSGDNTTISFTITNTLTVSFNSNEGTTIDSQSVNYNSSATEPSEPTRTGYTFGGWYKEAALTNAWDFDTDKVTGPMTLYAKWTLVSYTVSFDSNEGTTVSNQSVNYNSLASEPLEPTRTGYTFDGWYKESELTNAWDFDTDKVTGPMTLYAKWTLVSYTVSFDSNEGTTVSSQSVNYNSLATEPSEPTRTGYMFGGWYKEAELTNAWDFDTDKVTGPMTLYAKWTLDNYTVSFDSNEGTTVSNQSVNYNSLATEPSEPTRTGYTFGGWYKEAELTNAWDFDTDKVTGPMTLYAKWTLDNYTVSFDSNEGTTVSNQSVNYNSLASEPTAPTRTGYTFGGWYKEAALTNAWDFDTDKVTGPMTLYAKWTLVSYTVSFDSNEGTTISDQSVVYNNAASTPTAPTRLGYAFMGWYADIKFNTPYLFTEAVTANITLYAKWDSLASVLARISIAEMYQTQLSVNEANTQLTHVINGPEKDLLLARLGAVQSIINNSNIHIGDITKHIFDGTLQDINQDDIIDSLDILIMLDRIKPINSLGNTQPPE